MPRTDVVIIGGGQAGLAMSRCLTDRRIAHVVLERGRIAERWRSERWDSLRLLTPNWQSRLPGFAYDGQDPDGFMTMPEVAGFLERYARRAEVPIVTGTSVTAVTQAARGYRVATTTGTWTARAVVVATGYSDTPSVPRVAARLSLGITQVVPAQYRRPSQLPPGGVLVVGASATGLQLADELRQAGRDVTIAVGHHTRVPRTYRGRDILWWLDAMGVLRERADQVYDIRVSRAQPSFQLVGRPDRATLDLLTLRARGVHVVGRLLDVDGVRIRLDDDLVTTTVSADVKLAVLLRRIDRFAASSGLEGEVGPPEPFEPHWRAFVEAPDVLDLRARGVSTVLWATGFRRAYPWLRVPVLDEAGEIRHHGGLTTSPGLFVIGLQFLRRRNSSFIDGVGADARDLSAAIAHHLDTVVRTDLLAAAAAQAGAVEGRAS
jgi:putative flavoprotein involved in K+ transport